MSPAAAIETTVSSDGDPSALVEKVLEAGRNVRFGKGVVSKTSYIAAFVVAVWGIVAWKWSESLIMDAGLLIAGVAATIFGVWFIGGTRRFAERNPELALFEGAELLEWRKMEVAAKGLPAPPNQPLLEDKGGPPSGGGPA